MLSGEMETSPGAFIWTLDEKVGEKSGGSDWPTPHLTVAPVNVNAIYLERPQRGLVELIGAVKMFIDASLLKFFL